MIKPKGFLYLGLGMLGAIVMGIGCAQETQEPTVTQNKTSHVNTTQPEAIKVEIMMEEEQRDADLGVSAEQAPTSTSMTSPSLGSMPNALPTEMATGAYPGNAPVGAGVAPGATPGVGANFAPGIGGPGVGPGIGGVGPGIGGIDPGIGGFGPGIGGPGFVGDVPFGPGIGGPLFGLGYPFYVNDFIIVDDDSHRRRHRHHRDDDDTDEDAL